ncbi:TlpA family protein disulfide reductase [Kribbella albertanoniae]|uniref:TlpA family protein disulfide reductase n=1 Tax=Kribbella albertanoniae TaxID=1266829 RepID=A0A4R4P5E2_9ACTN|nr:TlpA family protein disulfide reductase [Kribbella albertanoniae]
MLTVLASCGQGQGAGTPGAQPTAVAGADKLVACPPTESRPPVSNGLPDITLPCLGSGPDVRLADLRGPLVINVWAQWCPPCRDEAPYLAELQKKAAGKLQILGIDYADPRPELAVKFARDRELNFPHLVDSEKLVRKTFKVGGPPVTVFVDKDGKFTLHNGVLTSQEQLEQLVRERLGVEL